MSPLRSAPRPLSLHPSLTISHIYSLFLTHLGTLLSHSLDPSLQTARIRIMQGCESFLSPKDFKDLMNGTGTGLVIKSIKIDYKRPVNFPDSVCPLSLSLFLSVFLFPLFFSACEGEMDKRLIPNATLLLLCCPSFPARDHEQTHRDRPKSSVFQPQTLSMVFTATEDRDSM